MLASTSVPDTRWAQIRPDQKLSEEKQVLRKESVNLLQREKEPELKVQELKCKLQVWGNAKWTLLTVSVSDNTSVLWSHHTAVQLWIAVWNTEGLSWLSEHLSCPCPGDAVTVC